MRKHFRYVVIPCFLWMISVSQAQTPDWATSVASIIYTNCSSCHHEGTVAPFSLMSYDEAITNAAGIKNMVAAGLMPPWPADPSYRHFASEAILSEDEKNILIEWVDGGMPSGDQANAPLPPEFAGGGSQLEVVDDYIQIPPYTLQYNTDEYRYFVIPSGFTDTMYVNEIEVIAGNDSIVHHADIYYDLSGDSKILDDEDPLPGFNGNTGYPSVDKYMNAWQPGGNIVKYPDNWGIMVPPGADFVLEIHYGPGGKGSIDSTRMNFKFVENPSGVRPITVQWLLYDASPCLLDGPLTIPANTVKTFHQKSSGMPKDRSFISICPHMHHVGVSYRVWFETTDGDSVPLINIPHWNFYWQKYYTFQQVQKIPKGARIYSEGVYDNTANNPENPNDPPKTVSQGATTADEMFDCYFIYADYKDGDENIILDSTLISSTGLNSGVADSYVSIYPNPATDHCHVEVSASEAATIGLKLYNSTGALLSEEIFNDQKEISERIDLQKYARGVYVIQVSFSGTIFREKIVKL